MASAKCRYLEGDARNDNMSGHRTDSQCRYELPLKLVTPLIVVTFITTPFLEQRQI